LSWAAINSKLLLTRERAHNLNARTHQSTCLLQLLRFMILGLASPGSRSINPCCLAFSACYEQASCSFLAQEPEQHRYPLDLILSASLELCQVTQRKQKTAPFVTETQGARRHQLSGHTGSPCAFSLHLMLSSFPPAMLIMFLLWTCIGFWFCLPDSSCSLDLSSSLHRLFSCQLSETYV
jgi:hypothetical protein